MEITFNGEECTVDGPDEIPIGTHVFVFHNKSDLDVHLVPLRHYPEKTWHDAINWVEENCGPPGTHCAQTASWMAGVPPERSVFDGLKTRYKQFDFTIAAEYSLWAESSAFLLWPCEPFFVVDE